jgi:hypothetical protein
MKNPPAWTGGLVNQWAMVAGVAASNNISLADVTTKPRKSGNDARRLPDRCAGATTFSRRAAFMLSWPMAKPSYDNIAKPIRKRSAKTGMLVGVRLQPELISEIDAWAAERKPPVTRPEAIRGILELGLTVKKKASPSQRLRAARADRAKELAAKTIEKIIDPTAPPGEREQRRRRLTKGPSEFREARVDQPKAKRKWAQRATTIKARWSISLAASYATKQWSSKKAPPTLKEVTSFNIAVACATELSGCDYCAEVEIRQTEGEG